ncbi:unnamed protein product [Rotaria socialis]
MNAITYCVQFCHKKDHQDLFTPNYVQILLSTVDHYKANDLKDIAYNQQLMILLHFTNIMKLHTVVLMDMTLN